MATIEGEAKTVVIIGASNDRRKFGNKAVRAFVQQGYRVVPVNPHEHIIEGLQAYRSILDVPSPIDRVSFYVPPTVGIEIIEHVAARGIKDVWFNPGAESDELVSKAEQLGIEPVLACSILAIGESPSTY